MTPDVENGSGVGVVKEVLVVDSGIGLLCFGSGGKLLNVCRCGGGDASREKSGLFLCHQTQFGRALTET